MSSKRENPVYPPPHLPYLWMRFKRAMSQPKPTKVTILAVALSAFLQFFSSTTGNRRLGKDKLPLSLLLFLEVS